MSTEPENHRKTVKAASKKRTSVTLAFAFGVIFVTVILLIALFVPRPTTFQYTVFRIILALAAAGVAAEIPGILKINIRKWLTASGALAVFVIVYFYSPAKLVAQVDEQTRQDLSQIKQNTGEINAKADQLLAAMRELSPTLGQVSQMGDKDSEYARLTRAYDVLEAKYKLPGGTLAKELPKFAEQLLQRSDTSVMDRASALFAVKKFTQAEAAALEAKDKALAAAGQPVKNAIAALELAGSAAEEQFKYARALEHYRAAAALTSNERDPIDWARVQHNVASVMSDQGDARQAADILHSVIKTNVRVLGPEHRNTLASRNNLANALLAQGRTDEAETEYRAVLDVLQRVFGPEHPDTLSIRNNLAATLAARGKSKAAEQQHRVVLSIRDRVLGPEHPDTLRSRNNLAIVMDDQGKYAEAEKEHLAVRAIRERVLGLEHPDTFESRDNRALALMAQGKIVEAENEIRAVLALRERVQGPEHPATLQCRNYLANLLLAQGRNAEAEQEHRAVLAIRERVLGSVHPDTLRSRHNLALVLDAEEKHVEAEMEYFYVIALSQHVLGPEHPDYSSSCYNLGKCLRMQGKKNQSLVFARRALEGWLKSLGAEHPLTKQAKQLLEELEMAK